MAMATVNRRWTIATWLLARADDGTDTIVAALDRAGPDAVLLQSVRRRNTEQIAAASGMNHAWACSHHPRSRLIPGSAVGLGVLSPHRITWTTDHVVGSARSLWSTRRRITQHATIERSDHSAYTISHAVERLDDPTVPSGAAPAVRIRPAQVGVDDDRAIELPSGASRISSEISNPIDELAPLLVVVFEMPWVQGDFTVR